MNIKRVCLFVPDREKGSDDGRLRYRIKWADQTVTFNPGYRVEFAKWSSETQRCKNSATHGKKKIAASTINRELNRFEQMAESVFNSFEIEGKIPSAEEFRTAFNVKNGKIDEKRITKTFFDLFDEFTSEVGRLNQWTEATFAKFSVVRNHLFQFSSSLEFADFTEHGLSDYVYFLRDVRLMRNSSISKYLGFLKWFLRWATAKGYNDERAFIAFSPKLKTTDRKVIFLDWDELMTVYNFDIPENHPGLARVRDVFCFCCFTSLRYSDVANLRRSNVFEQHIEITTVKTSDSLTIDLNDYSKEILAKYCHETFSGDLALPVISNQKMNDELKALGKLCGIDAPVTVTYYKGNQRHDEVYPKYALLGSHAGRRTFICNALSLGIPAQVVMKWTGHSDYKAMKPYIDIADKIKSDSMQLFNKKVPTT